MPLDFAASAGLPLAPIRVRACRAPHAPSSDQHRTAAVPASIRQNNGKAGSAERQVTYWPKTRVLPSVLFQKYLDHNAMDGYMGVHGYDNQEVAAATG